jgi:hypothetical protein
VRRLRVAIIGPVALLAFLVAFPFRVWWRARRNRTSLEDTLQAMAEDAYARMPPEMRAEIGAERGASSD